MMNVETLEWLSCCQMGAGSHNTHKLGGQGSHNTHNLGVQGGRPPQSKNIPIPNSKVSLRRALWTMISNFKLVSPFITLVMRHWNG
eukprot:scaffold3196_cov81-Cyclotella_meneghiniana.AAC.10